MVTPAPEIVSFLPFCVCQLKNCANELEHRVRCRVQRFCALRTSNRLNAMTVFKWRFHNNSPRRSPAASLFVCIYNGQLAPELLAPVHRPLLLLTPRHAILLCTYPPFIISSSLVRHWLQVLLFKCPLCSIWKRRRRRRQTRGAHSFTHSVIGHILRCVSLFLSIVVVLHLLCVCVCGCVCSAPK